MKRWILLMKSGEVNTLKHNYLAFCQNIAADRDFLRASLPPLFHFTAPYLQISSDEANNPAKPAFFEHLSTIS